MGSIVGLIVGFATLAIIGGIVSKILRIVKEVKPIINELSEGLEQQEFEYENNPKSVNGMTTVYLPRIEKDFPDFNYYEFKTKAENMLISAFDAISDNNVSELVNASSELHEQIRQIIDANLDARQTEVYKDVKIHQTEIKNYVKANGTCKITLQSSVGYHHFIKNMSSQVIKGSETTLKQTRYDTELIYIQDINKVAEGDNAVAVTCPNCGAPIVTLGEKHCPYCGSAVTVVNIRAWAINRINEL